MEFAENGAEDPLHNQPGDKQVQALEGVKADGLVIAEFVRGQNDDRCDPADARDVTKDRGGARRNAR